MRAAVEQAFRSMLHTGRQMLVMDMQSFYAKADNVA